MVLTASRLLATSVSSQSSRVNHSQVSECLFFVWMTGFAERHSIAFRYLLNTYGAGKIAVLRLLFRPFVLINDMDAYVCVSSAPFLICEDFCLVGGVLIDVLISKRVLYL